MPISGISLMHEGKDNLNADRIAADVLDELGMLNEPQAPQLITAIARAIRQAVEDERKNRRVVRISTGQPQQFEELHPGVRLWRTLSGEPVAIEIVEREGD